MEAKPKAIPVAGGADTHLFPKIDNVHVHLLFFQTFGQLDQLCHPKSKKNPLAAGGRVNPRDRRTVFWVANAPLFRGPLWGSRRSR